MRKLVMTSIAGATIAAAVLAPGAFAGPGTTVIYDNVPSPMPGNVPSQPYQAQQTREVGDQVAFAGNARELSSIAVMMSSWACENGHWGSTSCSTTPGASASVPVTLNLYNVGAGNSVGSPITSTTQTFPIPYRPSADPSCADQSKWKAPDGNCYNGLATPIVFTFAPGLVLPDQVIYGVALRTSTNGATDPFGAPLVMAQDNCGNSGAGCFVDSLNIAEGPTSTPPSVGTRPAGDSDYIGASSTQAYCDGGTGGLGPFRYDPGSGCWSPLVQFNAATPGPTCPSGSTTKSGNINGNLTVPSGQSYCLDNAHAGGDITVQKGASLTMINGSSAGHDVRASNPNSVTIDSSTVVHDVVVSGATGSVRVTNSTIGHDLNLTGNKGSVTADSNHIGHDMNVKSNTGSSSATHNTVAHYQNCTGNTSYSGSANTGTGAAAASCNTA